LNFETSSLSGSTQVSFEKTSFDLISFSFLCQLAISVSCGSRLFLFGCSQCFGGFGFVSYMILQGLFGQYRLIEFFFIFQQNFEFLFLEG
jgi:hypothetical protein